MRRASRVDSTHSEIVRALESVGCTVLSLAAVGKGCPDLLVCRAGVTWMIECKTAAPRKRKPAYIKVNKCTKDAQALFRAKWSGRIDVVTSAAEALASAGVVLWPEVRAALRIAGVGNANS